MRRLLTLIILLILALSAIWAGGETLLARQVRQGLAGAQMPDGGQISAAKVSALRNPLRFGVALDDLRLDGPEFGLTLPQLKVSAPVLRPNQISLGLPNGTGPSTGTVQIAGQDLPFWLNQPHAMARLAPLSGMQIALTQISAQGLRLDGRELVGPFSLDARTVPLGAGSPAQAHIAYDMRADLNDLDLAALPLASAQALPPGRLSLQGQARLWLDGAPAPQTLAAGQWPAVSGVRTGEIALSLGALQASVIADLRADPEGRAEGKIMVYSRDASLLLDHVVNAGYLTKGQARFALGMLSMMSQNGTEAASPITAGRAALVTADAEQAQDLLARQNLFRPAEPGELRLPLTFANGMTQLGSINLGPAPMMPAPY